MLFRTPVNIPEPDFRIMPDSRLLFVGSCFATGIGQRFADNLFQTVVNPYGVMYNPASILHTLQRHLPGHQAPDVALLTLGTNHVYVLKQTGEIVDNCQKRPAALFREEELTVGQCRHYLQQAVELLCQANPQIHIVITVSPIRYAKSARRRPAYPRYRIASPSTRRRRKRGANATVGRLFSCLRNRQRRAARLPVLRF